MFSRVSKIILLFIFVSALLLPNFVFGEDLEKTCQNIVDGVQKEFSKEKLKECQDFYKKQITQMEKDINKTGTEKTTLENKIYGLNKKIKNLDYQIYQSNLVVKDLGIQIIDTEKSITKTSLNVEESKAKLANTLRAINEEDQKPTIEILFSENDLSGFFDNLMALESLSSKNKELLQNIKMMKVNLEGQKQSLGEEKTDLGQTIQLYSLQKNESAEIKEEQEYYLGITQTEYQKQLKEKQATEKKAAEIEAKILKLVGLPEDQQINLGQAIEIAKYVETKTGVRPAFLVGLISGESALGRNVGQCYLKNKETGAGVIASTGKAISRVMKPMGLNGRKGDVDDFFAICGELPNRNAYSTLVSCPSPDYVGYGGAMGPAQFMPTTWVSCSYGKQVESITGKPADPWKPLDAFLAAGLLLRSNGAAKQTYNAEWIAAVKYLHGSYSSQYDWYFTNYINPRASCIQTFIDNETMSSDCENLIF